MIDRQRLASSPDAEQSVQGLAQRLMTGERMVMALSPWRRRFAALVAGLLSVLSMAPFYLWPVLWLTLPVLCLLADAAATSTLPASRFAPWNRFRSGRAAETGWWFGFGYFLAGLFWIGDAFLIEADVFAWLLPFAVTLLPAGLSLFTAAATASMFIDRRWAAWQRVSALAVGFGATEWMRGHILTGFPWNLLGYALTWPLPLLQSAAVFGVYGLTPVVVLIFAMPFALMRAGPEAFRWRRALAVALVPLALMWALGSYRLSAARPVSGTAELPKVRIVQPSIPQRERMLPENRRRVFDRHLELSTIDAFGREDGASGISLIVWPESAMPFLPLSEPVALSDIGGLLPEGTRLLSGGLRLEPAAGGQPRRVFNSALLFEGGAPARALSVYDKVHLVPFGEYLPAQTLLELIGLEQLTRQRGGFTAGGQGQGLMPIAGFGRVQVLICYEAIFPRAPRSTAERPDLMLTITNDSWFGDTTGPRQHYHQARVRAVELGVPMIRASTNGISGLIDGYGREQGRLPLNAVGTLDVSVPPALAATLFCSIGDWGLLAILGLLCCGLWAGRMVRGS